MRPLGHRNRSPWKTEIGEASQAHSTKRRCTHCAIEKRSTFTFLGTRQITSRELRRGKDRRNTHIHTLDHNVGFENFEQDNGTMSWRYELLSSHETILFTGQSQRRGTRTAIILNPNRPIYDKTTRRHGEGDIAKRIISFYFCSRKVFILVSHLLGVLQILLFTLAPLLKNKNKKYRSKNEIQMDKGQRRAVNEPKLRSNVRQRSPQSPCGTTWAGNGGPWPTGCECPGRRRCAGGTRAAALSCSTSPERPCSGRNRSRGRSRLRWRCPGSPERNRRQHYTRSCWSFIKKRSDIMKALTYRQEEEIIQS